MVNRQKLFEKIYGSLIGVAVGDAMGMPSEFWSREKIKNYFGKIETFMDAPNTNRITAGLKKGQVTDDTEQTIIVAKSIIENKGEIQPEKIIYDIIKWSEEERIAEKNIIGPSSKKAFNLIKKGVPIEETGQFGDTNGGAMKIVPVGIISDWRNLDSLVENVRLVCLPTHNTNLAISGAAAIAGAVSYSLDGNNDIYELISIAKEASSKGMEKGFNIPGPSINKRIDLGLNIVNKGKSKGSILNELYEVIGTGVSTTESIPVALSLVVLAKGNPIECSKLSANIGGDTDTIGAMACGICGALKGIEAFPKEYVDIVSKVNNINIKDIAIELTKIRQR